MGITQIIAPFYRKLTDTYRAKPEVGQLCWVPVPRLEEVPFVLDVERASPTEHYATVFSVRQMRPDDFRRKDRLPIKLLNLKQTEELVATRAKKRLAVIVSTDATLFADMTKTLRQAAQKHLQEQFVTVVPLFGIQSEDHPSGFPPVMVARIKALLYRQFFYCPEHSSPLVYPGVVRLDRIQPVMPKGIGYEPLEIALSPDAVTLLRTMLRRLLCGLSEPADALEENFRLIREIAFEALPANHVPSGFALAGQP